MKFICTMVLALGCAGSASAFGTIYDPIKTHQNREHGRITFHALGCAARPRQDMTIPCFQADSIDSLAGLTMGQFGAVGAPDNPARGLLKDSLAHCDNADYLDPSLNGGATYAQTLEQANSMLLQCRDRMKENLLAATTAAKAMLNPDGSVNDSQMPTHVSCTFLGQPGRAKCKVYEAFGLWLHAAQDFYAHSNWVDGVDPTQPMSRANPPGLGQSGPSPWIDLHGLPDVVLPVPAGLITGCFQNLLEGSDQNGCPGRVPHFYLNKDEGQIDTPSSITNDYTFNLGAGITPRGAYASNFQNAVTAAITETVRDWDTLIDLIMTFYGGTDGPMMVCALVFDNPVKSCTITSSQTVIISTLASRYLAATGGGGVAGVDSEGRTRALATVARHSGPSERFVVVPQPTPAGSDGNFVALRTPDGRHYLTAIAEGMTNDTQSAVVTMAQPDATAEFTLIGYADGTIAIRTPEGRFISAVDLGGIGDDANAYAFHTDAVTPSLWELFKFLPE